MRLAAEKKIVFIFVCFLLIMLRIFLEKQKLILTDSFIKEISEGQKSIFKNELEKVKNLNTYCLEKKRGKKDKKGHYISTLAEGSVMQYKCKNERLHGYVTLFLVGDEIKIDSVINFNEGELEGKSYRFRKNESVYFEADYFNRSGTIKEYFLNGKIQSVYSFKNFKIHLNSFRFYQNGNIKHIIRFHLGEIRSLYLFSEDGKIIESWPKK